MQSITFLSKWNICHNEKMSGTINFCHNTTTGTINLCHNKISVTIKFWSQFRHAFHFLMKEYKGIGCMPQ